VTYKEEAVTLDVSKITKLLILVLAETTNLKRLNFVNDITPNEMGT
jgi:hypothetical protein